MGLFRNAKSAADLYYRQYNIVCDLSPLLPSCLIKNVFGDPRPRHILLLPRHKYCVYYTRFEHVMHTSRHILSLSDHYTLEACIIEPKICVWASSIFLLGN
jgi:hypothetical protein